jgi:hypothetical protein
MAIFAGRLAIRWQGCPITPLGMRDGVTYWLDYRGEFRALTARQLGAKPELLALIGSNTPWLWEHFPKRTTRRVDGELRVMTVTYSAPALVEWLVKIAAECDMFGPQLVIRKPGVWPGEDGEPVAHLGDKLWIDHKLHPAGLRTGNMLWPAHPPVGKPGEACGPEIGKRPQLEMQELMAIPSGWRSAYVPGRGCQRQAWPVRQVAPLAVPGRRRWRRQVLFA